MQKYRELTVAAVVLGVVQGVILNVAFVYAALKLGFSIAGSTVAAIMGYAVLTGVMRRGTSVENNINQTIASGINTAGTGIVFTLPALFMLNAQWLAEGKAGLDFSIVPMIIGGIAGAILGTVLIIPLRKQMIEIDRLRFPSGVAVTTIIRAGKAGAGKAKLLAAGFAISAVWKALLLTGWLDRPGFIAEEEIYFGMGVLPDYVTPVLSLSLMSAAAGMLAGRGGLPFFLGGVLSWWVISPAAVNLGWTPAGMHGEELQGYVFSEMLRPLGIGTLIGGALMGVINAVQTGDVPMDKYLMGGGIGMALGAAPVAGLGVLIGLAMYLPFAITMGYGIGCMTFMALRRWKGAAFCEHKLVPLGAGLIVGEALTGVGHAMFTIIQSTIAGG